MKEYSKSEHQYALYWAKKIKSVNLLGGKCKKCGTDDIKVLTFHHHDGEEKEATICSMLSGHCWGLIKEEVEKCLLLCSNCHTEAHYKDQKKHKASSRRNSIKMKLILIKGTARCSRCGYVGENMASLTFHHAIEDEKEFNMSNSFDRKMDTLIRELDSCEVICSNCHKIEHIHQDKLDGLSQLIAKKVRGYKKRSSVDHVVVIEMYKKGFQRKEIADTLKYSRNTVKNILKQYRKSLNNDKNKNAQRNTY